MQFQALDCVVMPHDGTSFLKVDSDIDCKSSSYRTFQALVCCFVVIYQGIPFVWFLLLRRVRDKLDPIGDQHRKHQQRLRQKHEHRQGNRNGNGCGGSPGAARGSARPSTTLALNRLPGVGGGAGASDSREGAAPLQPAATGGGRPSSDESSSPSSSAGIRSLSWLRREPPWAMWQRCRSLNLAAG